MTSVSRNAGRTAVDQLVDRGAGTSGLCEPRVVVLVEGRSDRAALDVLARRRGLVAGVEIRAMGGATNVRRHLHEAVADAVPRRVLGLTDEPEAQFFLRALAVAGASITAVDELAAYGFHMCRRDLEDELIRALGVDRVRAELEGLDLGQAFERFCHQQAWRDRSTHEQLHRFAGTVAGRKTVFAEALAGALRDDEVPDPLRHLLDQVQLALEAPTDRPLERFPARTSPGRPRGRTAGPAVQP